MEEEKLEEVERYLLTLYSDSLTYSKRVSEGDEVMENYVDDVVRAESDKLVIEAYDKESVNRDGAKEEGFREGAAKARIESAKRMLAKGYIENDISEITGLSKEEVESLKSD